MKKIVLLATILVAITLSARDRLYIEDFTINPGQTVTVNLMLRNDTAYSAFQTDLKLPAGLELATEDDEYIIDPTNRLTSNHTISSYEQPNGDIRIFVTSQSLKVFTGNSGAIVTMQIKAANNFSGRRKVSLSGTVMVEEDGTKHTLDDCSAWASSSNAGILGDVDGNGMVDVDDVNAMINLILFYDQYKDRYPGSADLDGNGMVDVDDVNAIINIILAQ